MQTNTRCIDTTQKPAGVNLFASLFESTGQIQSVTGATLSFTKSDFNKAIAINFIDNSNQIIPFNL